ncbi:hypothetical protein GCM10028784_11070 [Myceligenerans cantabricum]
MLLNREGGQPGGARPDLRARFAAVRRAFGPWRRQRPFVGAVLVILAGLELLLSGPIDLGALADRFGLAGVPDMQLAVGIEGFQAIVLPIVLILLGVLSMLQPVHRVFYGVITLVISVYTLSGVNLGGWVVGFLLGAIGGVVVVSWSPQDGAAAEGTEGGDARSGGVFEVSDDAPPEVPDDATGDAPEKITAIDGGRQTLHTRSAAVALAGALVLGGVQPASLRTAGDICWDPLDWIPSITCDEDEDGADPSPSPSTSGSEGPVDEAVDDVTDGLDDAVDGVTGGSGGSGGSKDDGSDGSEDDGASPEGSDDAAAELFSTDASEKGLSVGYVCDGEKQDVTLPMIPAGEDNTNTFSLPADLRTSDLEISGIRSVALVSVPVTHEAERRDALRIVADHVKAPGFWLKSYAYDTDAEGAPIEAGTDTAAGYVSMDGDATLYISGINLGCPDFDQIADEPPESVIAWLLALSGAQMDLLGATSDVQVWSGFREQVWGDPLHPVGEGPQAGDP